MSESWQRFELHTTQQGETTCIALLGEFDVAGVELLEEELRRALPGVLDVRQPADHASLLEVESGPPT